MLAAAPPFARTLARFADSHHLRGYVLFSALGRRCPAAIGLAGEELRRDEERFIRDVVLAPAGAGPAG